MSMTLYDKYWSFFNVLLVCLLCLTTIMHCFHLIMYFSIFLTPLQHLVIYVPLSQLELEHSAIACVHTSQSNVIISDVLRSIAADCWKASEVPYVQRC